MREATPEEFKRDAVEEALRAHPNMGSKQLVPIIRYLAPECEDLTVEYVDQVIRELWPHTKVGGSDDQ